MLINNFVAKTRGFQGLVDQNYPKKAGQNWWNLMINSNESMDFNDPKKFDDRQLFGGLVFPEHSSIL